METLGTWSGELIAVEIDYPWDEPADVAENWDALDRYYEDHPEALADEESYHDYRAREEQAILL